jgi:hypothetical protein
MVMSAKTVGDGGSPVVLLVGLILAAACAGKPGAAGSAGDAEGAARSAAVDAMPRDSLSIRFAIQVNPDEAGPIYVLLNGEDGQIGWVKVFRGGQRIYLRERCEIEDCGAPAAVCGAALPLIRNIAGGRGQRSVEYIWDGMTSVVDSVSGCESRDPAPPGDYSAEFCFSREADLQGGDPTRGVPGRLVQPTCSRKPFALRDEEVVLII